MKPFDDTLPEEREEQHKELISLLHQAYQQSFATTADDQTQVIERVGKLLATLANDITFSASQETPSEQLPGEQALLREPEMMRGKSDRKKRAMHFFNTFAAVLMVGLLVSGAVALFTKRSQSTTADPVGPVSVPITMGVEVGGLEMILSVTAGPYFLSELIMADMSLTNHSHTTFSVRSGGACPLEPHLVQTGGESPHYSLPLREVGSLGCYIGSENLEPGQTLRNRQYEPLTSSGLITLTAQVQFTQNNSLASASSPLDGHWPAVQIQVASRIPSDRLLALHPKGSQISIGAPPTAQLVYRFIESCNGLDTGNPTWEPISTRTLNTPDNLLGCPAKDVRWQYAIGTAGYAIATGAYPS